MKLVAMVLLKPAQLTGPELRFLRKAIRLRAVEFVAQIGWTSPEHLSRCEAGKLNIGETADRLTRIIVADALKRTHGSEAAPNVPEIQQAVAHKHSSCAYRLSLTYEDGGLVRWQGAFVVPDPVEAASSQVRIDVLWSGFSGDDLARLEVNHPWAQRRTWQLTSAHAFGSFQPQDGVIDLDEDSELIQEETTH